MVGSFTIPSGTMTRLMRAGIGWESEAAYHLTSPGTTEDVVGKDKEKTLVTISVRLVDGGRGLNPPEPDPSEQGPRRIEITIVGGSDHLWMAFVLAR
eukprot:966698-Rhodomonas_salina.6